MVRFFEREYTREEIQARVGALSQLGGIRPLVITTGNQSGQQIFEVTTGSGLACTVLAARLLDIGHASYRGQSLTFLPVNHPGGLLITERSSSANGCDAGIPVEEIGYWSEWHDDEHALYLKGSACLEVAPGLRLQLIRHIVAFLGEQTISVEDTVENLGALPAPFIVCYRCTFGFPLVASGTQLVTNSRSVTPRDAHAAEGWDRQTQFGDPLLGAPTQAFDHDMATDNEGDVLLAIINRALNGGTGVLLTYHKKSLPFCTQINTVATGSYALGIELANNGQDEGREMLQPGEQRTFHLAFTVLDGVKEIEKTLAKIR